MCSSDLLAKRLADARNATVIADALKAVFGGEFEVTCVHGAAAAEAPSRTPAPEKNSRPAGQPRFSRPSQAKNAAAPAPVEAPAAPQRPAAAQSAAPTFTRPSVESVDDIPPPEAPDLPDDPGPGYDAPPPDPSQMTEADVEEMFAEAATPGDPSTRRDPEEVAIELLKDVLGAKPLDEK